MVVAILAVIVGKREEGTIENEGAMRRGVFSIFILRVIYTYCKEAKFVVSDWGIKQSMASGCRTGPPANVPGRAGTTTRSHSCGSAPQAGT